jgi:hypothetical protein
MKRSTSRGFRLVDVMILIAATAAGFSLVKSDTLEGKTTQATLYHNIYYYEADFAAVACPLWLAWTFAALAIRLRSPRPPFRRLARQPGWVASLSVSLCVPIQLALTFFDLYHGPSRIDGSAIPYGFFYGLRLWPVFVIVGAWLALWLNGRWRPEPSAIDRFGRALGFGWIAFFFLHKISYVLFWMGLGRLY